MADSFTYYWGLLKPEIGASRDTWGAKWNHVLDQLDALMAAAQPVGCLADYCGATPPNGWLLADGSVKNVADYPRLFAAIGGRYGGNGSTTFGLPDSRCRVTVGVGSNVADALSQLVSYALGDKGGAQGARITQAELPNYQLPLTGDGAHGHGTLASTPSGNHAHSGVTDVRGGHQHNMTVPSGTSVSAGPTVSWSGTTPFPGGAVTDVQGDHQHLLLIDAAGNHQHSFTIPGDTGQHNHFIALGGGGAILKITTMFLAVTKMVYAAPPSFQAIPAPVMVMPLVSAPMRGYG